MIINFDKLVNEGIEKLDIDETMSGFDVDTFKIMRDIKYKGSVHIADDKGEVLLDIDYAFKDECDRCLKDVSGEEKLSFERIYLIKEDKEINLDEEVMEYIILNKPIKVLCDINCKGLCDICGKNLNDGPCDCKSDEINPKFEKLKELLDK